MNDLELRGNAMLQELGIQRRMLGDRAAELAAENAALQAEIERLKKLVEALEKVNGA